MPSRQNIKKIVTPVEIQGDDAFVSIKNITVNEAKELQQLSMDIDKRLQPERERLFAVYATKHDKKVDELTDSDKFQALEGSEIIKESESFFYKYYSDYVMGWNWVLEDGTPMNQPHGNPEVFGTLTAQEFIYIQSLFKQDEIAEKK